MNCRSCHDAERPFHLTRAPSERARRLSVWTCRSRGSGRTGCYRLPAGCMVPRPISARAGHRTRVQPRVRPVRVAPMTAARRARKHGAPGAALPARPSMSATFAIRRLLLSGAAAPSRPSRCRADRRHGARDREIGGLRARGVCPALSTGRRRPHRSKCRRCVNEIGRAMLKDRANSRPVTRTLCPGVNVTSVVPGRVPMWTMVPAARMTSAIFALLT